MTGKFAAETAAMALSKKDVSEKTLIEYERKWQEREPLGQEYLFGKEFVNMWRKTAFNPEFMKKLVLLLSEMQWMSGFSPVFDWSTGHMEAFNDHLGHLLDLLPEFSDFAKEYVKPLAAGISNENRDKIANLLAGQVVSKLPGLPQDVVAGYVRMTLGNEDRRVLEPTQI